jgi:anti-sigma-K factor RskA
VTGDPATAMAATIYNLIAIYVSQWLLYTVLVQQVTTKDSQTNALQTLVSGSGRAEMATASFY